MLSALSQVKMSWETTTQSWVTLPAVVFHVKPT